MYYDDLDTHPAPAYTPHEALPARPRWPRLLGAVLFALLAVLHACS